MDLQFYRRKWNEIHNKAAQVSRGERSFKRFVDWIIEMPRDLPCKICRNHAIEYIRDNPPELTANPFYWSWQFHNAVNLRKGKPLMSYEDAADRYRV